MTMKQRNFYTATNLRGLIDAQGLRHCWVADQAGISAPLLSLILSGHRRASERHVQVLSTILKVPVFVAFRNDQVVYDSSTTSTGGSAWQKESRT